MSRPWLLGERRTLERRLEERSSGRSVARMFTERSVQSSAKTPGQLEVPLRAPPRIHFPSLHRPAIIHARNKCGIPEMRNLLMICQLLPCRAWTWLSPAVKPPASALHAAHYAAQDADNRRRPPIIRKGKTLKALRAAGRGIR